MDRLDAAMASAGYTNREEAMTEHTAPAPRTPQKRLRYSERDLLNRIREQWPMSGGSSDRERLVLALRRVATNLLIEDRKLGNRWQPNDR